ncbi:unnamed protein product [Rangifer tarandus platyrhynchus]|uniref:Uncharacterized protein n=2 Tax=Rangifer tarandus platyrhynchus TaxID=3082113 RepID=A0ABN8YCU0_RANTA|nr:unnamed protein product [Rangifer tarandus platyrhynchus]
MGAAPPGTVHFSGSFQLGMSQAAERSPSFPGGAGVSGASKPKSLLAVVGGHAAGPPGPSWGGGAPRLVSALMSMASGGGGAGAGSPRPVGAGLGCGGRCLSVFPSH